MFIDGRFAADLNSVATGLVTWVVVVSIGFSFCVPFLRAESLGAATGRRTRARTLIAADPRRAAWAGPRPAARARPLGRGPGGWDDMGM